MGKKEKTKNFSPKNVHRRKLLKAGLVGAASVPLWGISSEAKQTKRRPAKRPYKGLKIDAFCHILPPKYLDFIDKKSSVPREVFLSGPYDMPALPTMSDVDARIKMMERYPGYVQIINISLPPPEDILSPKDAVEACKIANDCMAKLVYQYPDRFVSAIACLPLNDMDAAIKELDRTILDLNFKGVQITTTIMDKPLDSPEFAPLFEKMCEYNLPIQMHPRTPKKGPRAIDMRDPLEFAAGGAHMGWPYETTVAMGRLVFSGMMEKYPNLKILTHHLGGFTPYHAQRIASFHQTSMHRFKRAIAPKYFSRPILDYYKMMYGDSACYGATPTLMNGFAFFGADHMLFATDYPFDATSGDLFIRKTIQSANEMAITKEERKKIFEDNARRLFRLPV